MARRQLVGGVCPHIWDFSRNRAGLTQAPRHMGQTSESSQSTVLRPDLAHKHILVSFCFALFFLIVVKTCIPYNLPPSVQFSSVQSLSRVRLFATP